MLLVVVLLFILLSPGVLLTLPPCSKGIWMTRQTSAKAVALHTLVFLAALYAVKSYAYPRSVDPFQDKTTAKGAAKPPAKPPAASKATTGSGGATGAKGK